MLFHNDFSSILMYAGAKGGYLMRFLQSLAIELEKFVHLYLIIRNSESYFLFYLTKMKNESK